jgi:hypothetical protein
VLGGDLRGYGELGQLSAAPHRELGRQAERLLAETDRRVAHVAAGKRPAVYYACGPKGLETASRGSINVRPFARSTASR